VQLIYEKNQWSKKKPVTVSLRDKKWAWYVGGVSVGAPEEGASEVGAVEGVVDDQVQHVDHVHEQVRFSCCGGHQRDRQDGRKKKKTVKHFFVKSISFLDY
jgi:hypothetical protein